MHQLFVEDAIRRRGYCGCTLPHHSAAEGFIGQGNLDMIREKLCRSDASMPKLSFWAARGSRSTEGAPGVEVVPHK